MAITITGGVSIAGGVSLTSPAGSPSPSLPTDSNFSDVSLLLNGDGTNGSTSFPDLSSKSLTVTAVADVQVSTSVKKFGTGSIKFDGTGDYLTAGSNNNLEFGTGDFTIEMWVNLDSTTNSVGSQDAVFVETRATGSTSTGFVFNCRPSASSFALNFYTDGSANVAPTGMSYGTWHHIAVSRESGTVRLFVNGVVDKTFTKTNNFSDTPDVTIGQSLLYSSSNISGVIDDLRITKGVARYTSNFTAPTAEFPTS